MELQRYSALTDFEALVNRDKGFHYQLMHRDTIVARSHSGNFADWDILEKSLLPYGMELHNSILIIQALKEREGVTAKKLMNFSDEEKEKWRELQDDYRFRVRELNSQVMHDWLSTRVLPLDRGNSKILYQILGLEQKTSKQYKAEIAIRFKAVSITDNFWLRKSTDSVSWSDVDVRRIPLHENLGLFALTGDSDFTLDSVQDIQVAAEVGLIGTYPKGCMRKGNSLYVVKGGFWRDVVAEWLSAQILGSTNIYGYCKYHLDDGSGSNGFPVTNMLTTFCEVMSTIDRDLVMAVTLPSGQAEEIAITRFPSQFAQIAVWDYLCGNTDRHSANWGFFREAPDWDITGLHDIYDNNKAFNIATYKESGRHLNGSIVRRGFSDAKTLEQGALLYNSQASLRFIKPIKKEWFKLLGGDWESCIREFQERCKVLQISVIVN